MAKKQNYIPVSIIIPCYNQGPFLADAVTSVIEQTYTNWECIIVNDGSTDESKTVAQSLLSKYKQFPIKLINQKNFGVSKARNVGISKAQYEWVLPLDGDDQLDSRFLEACMSQLVQNPKLNVICSYLQEFGDGSNIRPLRNYSPKTILRFNTMPYASLYRKELWHKVGGYDPSLPWNSEDWNFWISASSHALKVCQLSTPLLQYRVRENQGRFQEMVPFKMDNLAMLHTLHPDKYPAQLLGKAHEKIARMKPQTQERLEKINQLFPKLAMPYFWLGLKKYGDGHESEAATYLETVIRENVSSKSPCQGGFRGLEGELFVRINRDILGD